jgi:hypothetical protein
MSRNMISRIHPKLPAELNADAQASLAFMDGMTRCGSPLGRTPTDSSVGLIAPRK